eukprot:CAMPEP_0195521462 /NCGR_PEP_ID=MMETSP0794_2-20130614/18731_1 /TAXON_ID=515487 /ORGANISM="Stephanopyxis turris, Strain CCMP 815" /LENGTH=179 /DNA_ID=CAMNT_0040651025 /DNA_START=169 /DNA_END=708 /DNA_ORIENTATION=-
MKTDLLQDKNKQQIIDIWKEYHADKKDTYGKVLDGEAGKNVLQRAKQCPFFIQPVFREEGFFTLVSQYQSPSYFLMAYLEDYKVDPTNARPLITFSVFDDLATSHDVTLIRGELINKGIENWEGKKIINNMLEAYANDEDYEVGALPFNKTPESFDIDDYISCQNQKWKKELTEMEEKQ